MTTFFVVIGMLRCQLEDAVLFMSKEIEVLSVCFFVFFFPPLLFLFIFIDFVCLFVRAWSSSTTPNDIKSFMVITHCFQFKSISQNVKINFDS